MHVLIYNININEIELRSINRWIRWVYTCYWTYDMLLMTMIKTWIELELIFTCLSRVHGYPSCLSIDWDSVDRASLYVSTGCGSLTLTRGGSPKLVDSIWKIDKGFHSLTSASRNRNRTHWSLYLFNPFRDSELELSNEATVLQSGDARWR